MRELYNDRDYFDRMFASIDDHFFEMTKRLDKLNGSVARHEKVIDENLPHNIAHCPQAQTIETLKNNMVTEKAVKKTIYVAIGILGTLIGIVFALFEIFSK